MTELEEEVVEAGRSWDETAKKEGTSIIYL
jgi:hypothetical protein